jgi:hypothetical protein
MSTDPVWGDEAVKAIFADALDATNIDSVLGTISNVDRTLRRKAFSTDDTPVKFCIVGHSLTGQAIALSDHDVAVVWEAAPDTGWAFAPPGELPRGRHSTSDLVWFIRHQLKYPGVRRT